MMPWMLVFALATAAPAADPVVIHVSPHGLDGSTGRPATPTTGGIEDPFATPHRARDAIRELKRTSGGKLSAPVTVRLRAGTYEMAAPLVLEPEDSGTAECPIVYEAAPAARVVLSGGRALPPWTAATVNGRADWSVELPNVRAGKQFPHQLWVNEERRANVPTPELLDEPGEWHCDRATGRLSYLPRPGETPDRSPTRTAILPELVRLEGKPRDGAFVEHVTIRGVALVHWEQWPKPDELQSVASAPAGVRVVGARNCAFDRCTIAHGSGAGLSLGYGCRDCRVERCQFFDLGGGGVTIGDTTIPPNEADSISGNRVAECRIRDGGKVFPNAVAIWMAPKLTNQIEPNDVRDFKPGRER